MMHSLFWKIFLSFWISLIVFSLSTIFITSVYLERLRSQQDSSPRQQLATHIKAGQSVVDKQGIDGLKQWLEQLDKHSAIPLLLIDKQGNELLNRPVSEYLKKRLKRRSKRYVSDSSPSSANRRNIYLADEREYYLMRDHRSVTLGRVLKRPRVIAIPVLIATLISGLVCFLLARYLSAPIRQLRHATRQLAEGDLDQRVANSIGRRKDEMADLAKDFDFMAERMQRLLLSQKQLLNDASHELRSPLARLHMALGLIRQGGNNNIDKQLDHIERETERLNEIISSLLSLAKIESGNHQIEKKEIDLSELLTCNIADAQFEASGQGIQIILHNTSPVTLMANKPLLHSAIDNVLRNAIRYTQNDSIIDISLKSDPKQAGWVILTFSDQGPGVPEEMLEHLFEPFVRVESARDRQSGNYGLGLAITERSVNFHGGTVSAKNKPEGGLEIIIRLPC